MLHAKYIIYLTRTLLFLNKKKFVFVIFFSFFFFFFFSFSSKESMHLWIRNFCWLHWLNVKVTDLFCFSLLQK